MIDKCETCGGRGTVLKHSNSSGIKGCSDCAGTGRASGAIPPAHTPVNLQILTLQSKLTTLLEAAEARLENDLPDTRIVDQYGRPLGSCAASIIQLRAAVKKAREGL